MAADESRLQYQHDFSPTSVLHLDQINDNSSPRLVHPPSLVENEQLHSGKLIIAHAAQTWCAVQCS